MPESSVTGASGRRTAVPMPKRSAAAARRPAGGGSRGPHRADQRHEGSEQLRCAPALPGCGRLVHGDAAFRDGVRDREDASVATREHRRDEQRRRAAEGCERGRAGVQDLQEAPDLVGRFLDAADDAFGRQLAQYLERPLRAGHGGHRVCDEGEPAGRAVHGTGEGRELPRADAVVVRRDQHHARRAGRRGVPRERHGVALGGSADLGQHGRARARGDHGFQQRLALERPVQVELPRRAGDDQSMHARVDQPPRECRSGGEVDLLGGVVEREQRGVHPRRRHRHGGQDTVAV